MLATLFCLLMTFPATAGPLTIRGTVTSVHDGDTLRVGKQRIRLWGINAVELDERGGYAARNALRLIAKSKVIECTVIGKSYKRLVAQCVIDGHDIARQMVDAGMAAPEYHFSHGYYAR